MKVLTLSLVAAVGIIVSSFTVSDTQQWIFNFDTAKQAAQQKEKHILLSFQGSDWCSNCIRLEKSLFASQEFQSFADENLVLLKADFPMRKKNKLSPEQTKHNEMLADKFNKKGSFPLVVILDSKGNYVGTMRHPQPSNVAYINSIKSLID